MKKRFRLGRIVGAGIILSKFVYDQLYLSRELAFSPKCQGSINAEHLYPEFDDIPITPGYVGGRLNLTHPNQLVHFADYGLGHRLAKISSAWHLAKSLNLTRVVLFWGDCDAVNLTPQLFGSDSFDIPGTQKLANEAAVTGNVGKTIKLKNDVSGYYNGQNYKNHKVLLPKSIGGDECPFLNKHRSDVELYKILLRRFVGKGHVMKFMEEENFIEHFVIGIHLRLGNGEQEHFKEAGRGVDDEMNFVHNLLDLLNTFVLELQTSHPNRFMADACSRSMNDKRPLFFLATDSPKYIPIISNYTKQFGIQTIVVPQDRIKTGVTFAIKEGKKCVKSWYDMLLDDIVLSFSDVLVAARHSTFTQSMPMPLVFDRAKSVKGPHFCEVGDSGKTMTCLEDMRTWMFRDNPGKTFTYSTEDDNNVQEVIHHMTVHFPDVELPDAFSAAVNFLYPPTEPEPQGKRSWHGIKPQKTMTYGANSLTWFDMKYRGKTESCPSCAYFTVADK